MKSKQKPALHQDWIDPHAIDIVQKLENRGFTTYLVGGCVRDLLVGIHPKDFDIATTARPEDVRRAVPHSYIIGKRFRLVLVKRGDQQYEVATFRRNFNPEEFPDGAPTGDNVFGTPEEDASRRDFTINSLFYDPVKKELIDYNTGLEDLEERVIRMIGAPIARFREDPIRILRAIRLSHKLGFSLDPEVREAITITADTLPTSVLPRRREEILKILRLHNPAMAFQEAHDLGVLKYLSPQIHKIYESDERREVFAAYLERLPRVVLDSQNPVELFGMLALAYLRTFYDEDGNHPTVQRLLKDEEHVEFFKSELGMFKYEQGLISKALQIAQALERTDDFKRKGERRRMALLKNEAFPLALIFVESDYLLHPESIGFWHKIYEEALPQIKEQQREKTKSRRKKKSWNRKSSKADNDKNS